MGVRGEYLLYGVGYFRKDSIDLNLLLGETKNFHYFLFVIENSELFLPDFMEQSEILIHSESNELAHFYADIFYRIKFCDFDSNGFFIHHGVHKYLNFFTLAFLFLHQYFIRVMIELPTQFYLRRTKNSFRLSVFFLGRFGGNNR